MRPVYLALCLSCACGGKLDMDAGSSDSGAFDVDAADATVDGACVPLGQALSATFLLACGGGAADVHITFSANGYSADMGGGTGWSCTSAAYDGCHVDYTNCSRSRVIYEECDVVSTELTFDWTQKSVASGTTTWSCGTCTGTKPTAIDTP